MWTAAIASYARVIRTIATWVMAAQIGKTVYRMCAASNPNFYGKSELSEGSERAVTKSKL